MIAPIMPCKQNATYAAWKIWFEKIFPYLSDDELIIIWSSLWWTFLVKYLLENKFPRVISQLHLVAAPFDEDWLVDEYLADFLFEPIGGDKIESQVEKIFLYFSKDDPLCPFHNCEYYHRFLPKSKLFVFNNRWHFFQPALPELLDNIWAYKE